MRRLEQMDKETYGALREHHRVPQARFYYRIEPLVTTYTIITKRPAASPGHHRARGSLRMMVLIQLPASAFLTAE